MIKEGIDALVVCGGDGSLTGADLFRTEWPSLVQKLLAEGIVISSFWGCSLIIMQDPLHRSRHNYTPT